MKLLLIIIILIFSINTTIAQLQGQAKTDSLLKELPKMKEDTNGVNLLNNISFEYRKINPDEGIKYGKHGLNLSEKIRWELGKAKSYRSLGINYYRKSELPKALIYHKKALSINKKLKNKSGIVNNFENIGIIYQSQSDYPKALENYYKAMKINEEIGNKNRIANSLGNIGSIYFRQSNNPKALEYFKKALKIAEESGSKNVIANILGNIGLVYTFQTVYPKALEYLKKSLKMLEELGDKNGIASILGNIGILYNKQSDYQRALEYYFKTLKIRKETGDISGVATILGNIGELYLKLSQDSVIIEFKKESESISIKKEVNLNNAINYLKESINILDEIGEIHKKSFFLYYLSNAYTEKGDYKKAYETYKEHKKLNDSIFSSKNNTKIANLEAKRESEVKQKEIEILKAEKEKEKLQRYAMFGGIAGLGIIIGLILIQRRKSEKLLLNVLPAKIAKRLKAKEHPIADHFDNASIIFIDIVGFTSLSSDADPKRVVSVLNDIFTIFDKLADKHGLEKIKTIGDAYMAVAGIPEIQDDHSKRAAQMALDIKQEMKDFKTSDGTEIKFRIGIDCGTVVAGVIGEKKFIYDLWSDAVNTASRMESTGESGQIQITENFKTELEKFEGNWNFILRGEFEIKGKGLMKTYFLEN